VRARSRSVIRDRAAFPVSGRAGVLPLSNCRSRNAREAHATPLSVEIVAVPREIVVSITDELALAGLRASAIGLIAARNATPLFLPRCAWPRGSRANREPALSRCGLLLALVAVFSWPVAQQFRLAALEREIAALKPAAEATLHARQEHRRDADQAAEIARLRTGRPPLIAIIEALSRELPDGSWLTSLSIAGRDVMLEG
jgi:hypothetical protein